MQFRLLMILFFSLLTACSGVPYDPSRGRTDISTDLQINEKGLDIVSKCNFYPFIYGKSFPAKMRSCLFVVNESNIFFIDYNNETKKHYPTFTIPFKEIKCSSIANEEPGKGIIQLFTVKNSFSIALLHENNDLNHEAVQKLKAVLSDNSIQSLNSKISTTNPLIEIESEISSPCTS